MEIKVVQRLRGSRWGVIVGLWLWGCLPGLAQGWTSARDDHFTVLTAAGEDARHLPRVFAVLQQARRDLREMGLVLPAGVTVVIHPDLSSFQAATGAPWYVAAVANRREMRLEVQRLRVLLERRSLEPTLRHELFHLAQPDEWPRWLAEAHAMRFAGERPTAPPLPHITEDELNRLLAEAPSRELLARAAATAYLWVERAGWSW